MEKLILVDNNDNQIGTEDKLEAHKQGKLHRAFSIIVFNSNKQMLIQKRPEAKYHSGGLWANACCSHPFEGEDIEKAAHRRLKEEMGFDCELKKIMSFIYKAKFDNGLIENEFDHVFEGHYDGPIEPNKDEVEEFAFISLDELKQDVEKHPEEYTPWFLVILYKLYGIGSVKDIEWNVVD